jgi:hypothetical protein
MRAGASWRQRVFLGALPSTADDARVASVSRRQIDVSVGSKTEVATLRRDVCFAPDSVAKVVFPKASKMRAAGAVFV